MQSLITINNHTHILHKNLHLYMHTHTHTYITLTHTHALVHIIHIYYIIYIPSHKPQQIKTQSTNQTTTKGKHNKISIKIQSQAHQTNTPKQKEPHKRQINPTFKEGVVRLLVWKPWQKSQQYQNKGLPYVSSDGWFYPSGIFIPGRAALKK